MKKAVLIPMDVKLMQWTTIGLFLLAMTLFVSSSVAWLLRHPVFSIQSITVRGNVTHSNPVTLRANVVPQLTGNFFTLNLLQARQARIPLPFMGDGRDTARAVLFLASDEARFITGSEIVVDGGMSVRCD